MKFTCPDCKQKLEIDSDYHDDKVECPTCRNSFCNPRNVTIKVENPRKPNTARRKLFKYALGCLSALLVLAILVLTLFVVTNPGHKEHQDFAETVVYGAGGRNPTTISYNLFVFSLGYTRFYDQNGGALVLSTFGILGNVMATGIEDKRTSSEK